MTAALLESDVEAPLADAIVHLLEMHAERPRRSADTILTYSALALIMDYQPADIPFAFLEACDEAAAALRVAHQQSAAIADVEHRMVPSVARDQERRAHAELRDAARHEARRIIRHKITLEGPDL